MSGNKNKIIAFNYFGGKFSWLDELYVHFPKNYIHFVDVFGGSFSVSLNLKKKCIKTANEINSDVTNFFEVLRNNEEQLLKLLLLTPCSISEFNKCYEKSDEPIEQARRFYVRVRQSFFALGAQRQNKGFHLAKTQMNCDKGETVSKWNNALKKLHVVAEIIRENFQITNYDYSVCFEKLDFEGALFYLDPPYPKETRASFNDYKFEFSTNQHIDLADKAHNIKGKAMISSYNSDLYNELYKDWRKVEFKPKNNNIRSSKVQEVIWMNYENDVVDLFNN